MHRQIYRNLNRCRLYEKETCVKLTYVARNAYAKMKNDELSSDDVYSIAETCNVYDDNCRVTIYKFVNGFRKEYVVQYFELIKCR